ncbi:hypothetical protein K0U27_10555 [archaeon]|nr:hypothetical protein [archaeon]
MAKTSEELFNDWLLDSYSMRYLLIMIFTLLIPMLLGNSADACQYVPSNNTLQEDFEEHDFVFSGKILTVGKYVAYTPVTLEIIEQWKGEPHEKVYLFTCAGKNSGGLQFEEGKSYLIFAEKLANNEEPIVTDFGPTKLLSNAKKDILFLDQQAHNTRFTYEHEIEQKPNYQFIDFSYANKIGDPIQFILEKTAKNQCNSYTATITDENGDIVWTQQRGSLCVVADDSSLQTSQIKLGYDTNNPIIIDESGTYLIKVQIDDRNMEREFIVRQNHTGISLDSMTYPVP